MSTMTTGRTLDERGQPVSGTGFEIDSEGPIATKLRERKSPLVSNPITGEWVTALVDTDESNGEYRVGMGIFSPGNEGPPRHYHVGYVEEFEVVEGEFVIEQDGVEHQVSTGDRHDVPSGAVHTFRNVGDDVGAVVVTTRPPARTDDVIHSLFGMAHEGKVGASGQPAFLQAILLASETADDTVFTSPPPVVAKPLARVFAPVARLAGYQRSYDEYLSGDFWERHVEQPTF